MAKYKRQYNTDTNKFEDNPNVGKSTLASNTRKKMKAKAKAEAKAPKPAKKSAPKKEKAPQPADRSRGNVARADAKRSVGGRTGHQAGMSHKGGRGNKEQLKKQPARRSLGAQKYVGPGKDRGGRKTGGGF